MGNKQGQATVGIIVGGFVGGILGLSVGGFLGPILAGVPRQPADSPFVLFDHCFGFVFGLIGAAIGGVILAVLGAVLGAQMIQPEGDSEITSSESSSKPSLTEVSVASTESTEMEIERLKERIAELEQQRDVNSQSRVDT